MKFIIFLALSVTCLTAVAIATNTPTCEERGGHYEYLKPLDWDKGSTRICILPDGDE